MTQAATNQLAIIARQNGIATDDPLLQVLAIVQEQLDALVQEADKITVTAADQLTEMKQARELRLKFRELRLAAENNRKKHKEESLRRGKAIDSMANWIKDQIEPAEKRLQELEDFAVRAEATRKEKLRTDREQALRQCGVDTTGFVLGDMTEETYRSLLQHSQAAQEQKIAAARQAEEARLAAEAARTAEEARMRAENERLRQEAQVREAAAVQQRQAAEAALRKERDEREAAMRVERERSQKEAQARAAAVERQQREQERVVRAEREAREKAEAELRAQRAREAAKVAEEERRQQALRQAAEAAARQAALAPDKQRIAGMCELIRGLELPAVTSPGAKAVVADVRQALLLVADHAAQKAQSL